MGIPYQFGHICFQEALHCLRSALTLRRHQSLKSYVLFIDLVKVFDSIQHEVLYKMLFCKYGLPESLVDVINKLYNSSYIQLSLGKIMESVPYKTGVQQGDNMAPLLFLFVMQAVIQILKDALQANQNTDTSQMIKAD